MQRTVLAFHVAVECLLLRKDLFVDCATSTWHVSAVCLYGSMQLQTCLPTCCCLLVENDLILRLVSNSGSLE